MISAIGRIGLLGSVLLAGTAQTEASSVLNFPRLAAQPDSLTGVALVNPSAESAAVQLTAFGGDGTVIGQAELEIPAGRQVGFLTGDVFPGLEPSTVGWFQASSETPGLTGFYLFLTLAGDQFDGADLPPAARRIAFPLVRVGGGFSTELNVVNPGNRAATVQITLQGGSNPTSGELELAPRGVARLDAATFLGVSDVAEDSYLLAESSEDLLGFELVRLAGRDLVGLNARVAAGGLRTVYFPQFAAAAGIRTELTLINSSSRSTTVELAAHRPDGALFSGVGENPLRLDMEPGRNRVEDLTELFGFPSGAMIEGWLEVRASSSSVTAAITYRVAESGAAASVAPVARGSRGAIFSHIATTRGFFTGVAALNPGSAPADLSLVALSADGQPLGRFNTVLGPGERISRLITDLIPASAGQAGGFTHVAASRPVFLTSLFGTLDGSVLANIPPQSAPSDYVPDAGFAPGQVVPAWASLPPSGMQSFEAVNFGDEADWSATLPAGSGQAAGTIATTGLYSAPASFPDTLPVTVTASGGGLAASAAVDIVAAEPLASGSGEVRRLAYLPGLRRLYAVLSFVPPGGNPAGGDETVTNAVYEIVPPDERALLVDFGGERISSLIGARDSDGGESLLVAARTSGRLLRIDPLTGQTRELVGGLDDPSALALDPVSGNLLLAESGRVSRVSRFLLEGDSSPGPATLAAPIRKASPIASIEAGGVAVDQCSGNIFFSETATGRILELVRSDGSTRVAAEGLFAPTRLVGLYRRGVDCPLGFHLLVVQEPGRGVALVVPAEGAVVNPWLAEAGRDVAVLDSADGAVGGLATAESAEGEGVVSRAQVDGLYQAFPVNPSQNDLDPTAAGQGPDMEIASAVAYSGGAVTLRVRFRPGPAEASTGALVFAIDFDRGRLGFDPTDANQDGLPDAIESNLPPDYFVGASFDPDDESGVLGLVIVDSVAPLTAIPEGALLNVTFTVRESTEGSADVVFAPSPAVSLADLQARPQVLDEALAATVTVIR